MTIKTPFDYKIVYKVPKNLILSLVKEGVERMKADALDMLIGTIKRHEEHVTDEDINYAADLFLELERYDQCLTLLEKYCGFQVKVILFGLAP